VELVDLVHRLAPNKNPYLQSMEPKPYQRDG
jgi:hypothetical protein